MRRTLLIAGALVIAPVSYTFLLAWLAGPLLGAAWFAVETISRAQFWALVIISPIIVATKAYEALKRRGLI